MTPRASTLAGTAFSLRVDGVTAEVAGALGREGVPHLLLRGPVVAEWLYPEGGRAYADCDLLVDPDRVADAEHVLRRAGFAETHPGVPREEPFAHAATWRRDGVEVDLHATLVGVRAPAQEVWAALSAGATTVAVASARVAAPGTAARALVVALHAAQHGGAQHSALGDLDRSLARLAAAGWDEVAALAARLDARDALAAGLRLRPDGAVVADRLGLPADPSTLATLRASAPPATAIGFARLAAMPGARGKLAFAARKAFPSPAFMRWWSPLARRGPLGLAAAYAWRPLWLARNAAPGMAAWLRARRRSAG